MKSSRKSTNLTDDTPYYSRPIRRIQDFDELKYHYLTVKNMLYPHQRYVVYNTLVYKEEATGFTSIRRIHQGRYGVSVPTLHKKPRRPICRIQKTFIHHIKDIEFEDSGRYRSVFIKQTDTAYPNQLNTAYRSSDITEEADSLYSISVLDYLYFLSPKPILLIVYPLFQ
ncbi:hypothetical protein Tco_1198726, partial [Tanacetum coccineum]